MIYLLQTNENTATAMPADEAHALVAVHVAQFLELKFTMKARERVIQFNLQSADPTQEISEDDVVGKPSSILCELFYLLKTIFQPAKNS